MPRREVHVILPGDIDDPAAPSGGNTYDRHVCRGLAGLGWAVHEHPVAGAWPRPAPVARAALARVLAGLPDHAIVLLDGLVASAVPEVLAPEAQRLRLVALVHMPLGDVHPNDRPREWLALSCATAVIVTSDWARRRLIELYAVPADRVHVAVPGAQPGPVARGSDTGSRLLCVAAVTPLKGHDLLTRALAGIGDLPWSCLCVGALDKDPGFVERLRRQTAAYGLADRVRFCGPRTGADLDAAYAAADLLVLPSRSETYGMVVTEALARGLPVVTAAAKGLPEALGRAPDGSLPGVLVPPDDPPALAGALRRWLGDPDLRRRLRRAARARRATLTGWSETSGLISAVLDACPDRAASLP